LTPPFSEFKEVIGLTKIYLFWYLISYFMLSSFLMLNIGAF